MDGSIIAESGRAPFSPVSHGVYCVGWQALYFWRARIGYRTPALDPFPFSQTNPQPARPYFANGRVIRVWPTCFAHLSDPSRIAMYNLGNGEVTCIADI
eukprot:3829853-Rhodomonas_salina.4